MNKLDLETALDIVLVPWKSPGNHIYYPFCWRLAHILWSCMTTQAAWFLLNLSPVL